MQNLFWRFEMKNTERYKKLEYIPILAKIPRNLLNKFDQYCEDNSYTRIEGIRHAMRKKLKEESN
jgi:metal-responsive CopG/Arc/MetJ family transcriptional regulator